MRLIDKNRVILLFRTESEDYERPFPNKSEIESKQLETVIANELREQINNGKDRSIFSLTLFLAVAVFKYNPSGFNDLLVVSSPSQALNSITLRGNRRLYWLQCKLEDDRLKINSFDPYASFLDADLNSILPEGKYIIENYLIDVCKEHNELDYYLWFITGKGKKRFAACKSDGEVLARNIVEDNDSIIMEKIELQHGNLLDFVYVLYALYYKGYLHGCSIIESIFSKNDRLNHIINTDEYKAFEDLQAYMCLYISIDHHYCNELIQERVSTFFEQDKIGQYSYSDGYQLAMNIMNTNSFEEVFKIFCDSDYNLPSAYDHCNPFILTLFSILFPI